MLDRPLSIAWIRCRYPTWLSLLLAFGLSLLLGLFPLAFNSEAVPISSVPDPRLTQTWVSDTIELITPNTETQLNKMISTLEAQNGSEILVVTVQDTQTFLHPTTFAIKLMETWKINEGGRDNGVLLLISKQENLTLINKGPHILDRFSRAEYDELTESLTQSLTNKGDFEENLVTVVRAIINKLERSTIGKGENPSTTEPAIPLESKKSATPHPQIRVGILFLIAIVTIFSTIRVRKTFQKGLNPVRVAPVGTTQTFETGSKTLNFINSLRWLATGDFGVSGGGKQPIYYGSAKNVDGIIIECWAFSCISFIGLWIIFGLGAFNQGSLLCVLWLWLGFEMWCSTNKQQNDALGTVTWKLLLVFILLFGLVISPLWLGKAHIDWFPKLLMSFSFIASVYAVSCALSIRLLRSLPKSSIVICQSCDDPMQRLDNNVLLQYVDNDILSQHLKPSEMMALVNKKAEGWHCPICSPVYAENGLDFHLFSKAIRRKS